MATGGGENEKDIQEKKEERTYEGREDIDRVLETLRGLFRRYLRSSW
jgi:hypothetical protein